VDLLEKYGAYAKLRIPLKEKTLGTLFGLIEELKISHDVSEYSVSQTTLD